MKESSLYIHVPYCASKCIYCDFFSGGAKTADWERLVMSLANELRERRGELQSCPDTLYIGGGTPSLMPLHEFSRLVGEVNEIVGHTGDWKEFTIEVNPDDVSEEKCREWRKAGVNRVSIGIQSLNDAELRAIRRRHDSYTALTAYRCLRENFSNVSVDLMFGIPGQTVDSWRKTVGEIIRLNPQHLSAYSLMLEEGTPLTVLYGQGKIDLPDDDQNDAMWRILSEELGNAGYEQYEISNYSRVGYRSVHNSRYWAGNPYLGLGPSAHSYDGFNIRRSNPGNIGAYLRRFTYPGLTARLEADRGNFYEEEILTEVERIEERILTRMRVREGINLEEFRHEFGEQRLGQLLRNAEPLLDSGKIKISAGALSLTPEGVMTSDGVILALSMLP